MFVFAVLALAFTSCKKDNTDEALVPCEFVDFRYYGDHVQTIGELSPDYLLVGIDESTSRDEFEELISDLELLDHSYSPVGDLIIGSNNHMHVVKTKDSKSCEELTGIIQELEQLEQVQFVHYTVQTDNCDNLIWEPMGDLCVDSYSNEFLVKVEDPSELSQLNELIEQTNTTLVEQNQYMEQWFTVSADKQADGDAMAMANLFFLSGHFLAAEPQILKRPVQ